MAAVDSKSKTAESEFSSYSEVPGTFFFAAEVANCLTYSGKSSTMRTAIIWSQSAAQTFVFLSTTDFSLDLCDLLQYTHLETDETSEARVVSWNREQISRN